jgi:hypothetical protein
MNYEVFKEAYLSPRKSKDKTWYGWQVMDRNRMIALLRQYIESRNTTSEHKQEAQNVLNQIR